MEEIDLKDLITILWNKKKLIIITTLVFALVALFAFGTAYNLKQNAQEAHNSQPMYYAETNFIVGTSETTTTTFDQPITDVNSSVTITESERITQTDTLISTYEELIKSKTSLDKIISDLELDVDSNTLSSLISFSRVSDSDLLSLVIAYKDESKVVQIANELINEFISNMSKAYSLDKVAVIDEAYMLSSADVEGSELVSGVATSSAIAKSSLKHTIKYTVVSAFVGLVLSVGVVLFLEMFDNSIKNEDMLENLANLCALVTIEKNKEDVKDKFAILKTILLKRKTILITSAERTDNTTYISKNLATSFTKAKSKVLLLDLNSNESDLIEKYDGKGLLDFINEKNKDINNFISKSTVDNLDVLLIGNNTNTYLEDPKLQEVIKSLENTYDTIIINSKNVLDNSNALLTSKIAENTILVATERKTDLTKFNKAQALIKEVNGNTIGSILVK